MLGAKTRTASRVVSLSVYLYFIRLQKANMEFGTNFTRTYVLQTNITQNIT